MDILKQINKQIDEEFSSIKREVKPYTKEELKAISDYDQGMKDAEKGIKHESKSEAYTQGYGDQYAYEQTIDTRVVI